MARRGVLLPPSLTKGGGMATGHGGARRRARGLQAPLDRRFELRPGLPAGQTGGDLFGGFSGAGPTVRDAGLPPLAHAADAGEMDLEAAANPSVWGANEPSKQAGLFSDARSGPGAGAAV